MYVCKFEWNLNFKYPNNLYKISLSPKFERVIAFLKHLKRLDQNQNWRNEKWKTKLSNFKCTNFSSNPHLIDIYDDNIKLLLTIFQTEMKIKWKICFRQIYSKIYPISNANLIARQPRARWSTIECRNNKHFESSE